jgi:hypothetical protein
LGSLHQTILPTARDRNSIGLRRFEFRAIALESIPAYLEGMKKKLSPYDLPQSNDNPMRPLLAEVIDFDRLRLQEEIQLTVSATNARTARRRIFTNRDISVDALLASACLPQLFRAVEIDGEPYWDGTLTGNLSTPEQKCFGGPEQKYISEAGKKARRTGGPWFRHQAWIGLSAGVSELAGRGRRLL